jgi:hypothetical protein
MKDCTLCVYDGVCEERLEDETILDCLIPVGPLRRLQKNAQTAEDFITVTNEYIFDVKSKSYYWNSIRKS